MGFADRPDASRRSHEGQRDRTNLFAMDAPMMALAASVSRAISRSMASTISQNPAPIRNRDGFRTGVRKHGVGDEVSDHVAVPVYQAGNTVHGGGQADSMELCRARLNLGRIA
jgi:hypothetical protein